MSEEYPSDSFDIDNYSKPIEEAELLLFLLDVSDSMSEKNSHSKRKKIEIQREIFKGLISRIEERLDTNRFRFQNVFFSNELHTQECYQTLNSFKTDYSMQKPSGSGIATADALLEAKILLDKFEEDRFLPFCKFATVFLMTDGHTGDEEEARSAASTLKNHILRPALVTVGVGRDVNEELLVEIASETNPTQRERLQTLGLDEYLPQNNRKYVIFSGEKELTEIVEILNRFLYLGAGTTRYD